VACLIKANPLVIQDYHYAQGIPLIINFMRYIHIHTCTNRVSSELPPLTGYFTSLLLMTEAASFLPPPATVLSSSSRIEMSACSSSLISCRFRDGGDAVAVAAGLLLACLAGRGGGVSSSGLAATAAQCGGIS
jgi:hypothetical protein